MDESWQRARREGTSADGAKPDGCNWLKREHATNSGVMWQHL